MLANVTEESAHSARDTVSYTTWKEKTKREEGSDLSMAGKWLDPGGRRMKEKRVDEGCNVVCSVDQGQDPAVTTQISAAWFVAPNATLMLLLGIIVGMLWTLMW